MDMNINEIEHQLKCFDLLEIDFYARISTQKFLLRQLYKQVFDIPEHHFDKMYDELYLQNLDEQYNSIPSEKRHDLLKNFYQDIIQK